MADNLANWQTMIGEIFNIKRPEQGEDDKTYFTMKTLTAGKYVNCTLWDNSHGENWPIEKLNQGDIYIVNGKLKKKARDDGGFWYNLSISRIGVAAIMDEGVYDDGDDEEPAPKAKAKTSRKRKPAADADEGRADDDEVM